MLRFILRRLALLVPVLLGLSVLLFLWLRALPGNPATAMLGQRATPEGIARVNAQYGFDQPVWEQYLTYVGALLQGDFGDSTRTGEPVVSSFLERFPATIEFLSLVEELGTGEQTRLPAGEAMLVRGGSEQIRAALGSDPALYHELLLVDATAEASSDGTVLFSGEAFAGPGARHDLDALQDTLAPGAQMTIPAGALPTLVLILSGGAGVTTEAGDVFSLGADEAVALSGSLVVTAAENGAEVAATYTGPAVPLSGAGGGHARGRSQGHPAGR